jgi:hypothetical protein
MLLRFIVIQLSAMPTAAAIERRSVEERVQPSRLPIPRRL